MKYVQVSGFAIPVPSTVEARILEALVPGEKFGNALANDEICPQGSAYVILQRLETEGLVVSRIEPRDPKEGGLPRRFYSLTPEGHKILQAWKAFLAVWRAS